MPTITGPAPVVFHAGKMDANEPKALAVSKAAYTYYRACSPAMPSSARRGLMPHAIVQACTRHIRGRSLETPYTSAKERIDEERFYA